MIKKTAIIIAAYPGMGQEIFVSMYDDYRMVSSHDYIKKDGWVDEYIKDVLNVISDKKVKVCFIDTSKDVIDKLITMKPFLICYPKRRSFKVLETLALLSRTSNYPLNSGKTIADVILCFDKDIDNLRKYSNSIQVTNGFITEELIKQFINVDDETLYKIICVMNTLKKNKKTKI